MRGTGRISEGRAFCTESQRVVKSNRASIIAGVRLVRAGDAFAGDEINCDGYGALTRGMLQDGTLGKNVVRTQSYFKGFSILRNFHPQVAILVDKRRACLVEVFEEAVE